ncbi:hypothetical protein C8F04DRAFT_1259250 [Mycena alexandri]|uniref:Uncharacterized protein n=1 Tax=Mycena alexandri TaxID=1745969 RepID=A0AAD6SWN7_9AGAR|nr:hypothetical protein C8F04DRAFT_1259250 [Mycena alexandri]
MPSEQPPAAFGRSVSSALRQPFFGTSPGTLDCLWHSGPTVPSEHLWRHLASPFGLRHRSGNHSEFSVLRDTPPLVSGMSSYMPLSAELCSSCPVDQSSTISGFFIVFFETTDKSSKGTSNKRFPTEPPFRFSQETSGHLCWPSV